MKSTIIIPARYHSTRFPGNRLALIAGRTMLHRVCDIALSAANRAHKKIDVLVATDDDRIVAHAGEIGVQAIMTPHNCKTGTDRILAAIEKLPDPPDFILNLQGDAPLTPVHFVEEVLDELLSNQSVQWVTPVARLSWDELDKLRHQKQVTPFSGTTVILDHQDHAIWFSKNIIPAIRNESELRKKGTDSPVYRHIGIYGCTRKLLQTYVSLQQTPYEILEGLEQLRLLESGYRIRAVKVKYGNHPSMSGIDTPEDARRAEELIIRYREIP